MDISVELAGLHLEHPVMNGAGSCKQLEGKEGVREMARSAAAAIVLGSITVPDRSGNEGDVYYPGNGFSLNSLRLPNPGSIKIRADLPEMVQLAHEAGKVLIMSAAGFSPDEYAHLANVGFDGGVDMIELNLGCPNVWQDGQQERIACFDPEIVSRILACVESTVGTEARVAVKISPFSDPFQLQSVAQVLGESQLVKVVVSINTFPNALSFDPKGKPTISPADGLSGLAGQALKPIALGQIKQLRALLPERIRIVGVGGIQSGQDIIDFRRAGADAVQVMTALLNKGPNIFSTMLEEYVALLGSNSRDAVTDLRDRA